MLYRFYYYQMQFDIPKAYFRLPMRVQPVLNALGDETKKKSTCLTTSPYENGEMFNMLRSVASEAPTLSPGFKMCTSLMISMVPAHKINVNSY